MLKKRTCLITCIHHSTIWVESLQFHLVTLMFVSQNFVYLVWIFKSLEILDVQVVWRNWMLIILLMWFIWDFRERKTLPSFMLMIHIWEFLRSMLNHIAMYALACNHLSSSLAPLFLNFRKNYHLAMFVCSNYDGLIVL